ncbi:porin family protein [uncultured Shimia sp.]|uniref:outer membrane protein n=1 Tax=uncultured Shimia sp. TaxID=573152 RepID=UPI002616C93C|nr:porin family protein [uncultured Shimia sp.]
MVRMMALSLGMGLAAGVASAQSTPDWSGFYIGGQIGNASVDTSLAGVDGSDVIGGLVAGYDLDLGTWVVGAGFDYDWSSTDLSGAATLEEVWRLKARAGYKVNQGLVYGVGGYADASTDTLGSDGGWFLGAGYEHRINDSFSIGGELLYHEFGNFNGTGIDVDATTIQIRAAFRF